MKCIKCGKDTTGTAVFCEECLADMAQHPVKPDTPVILPKRTEQTPVKHNRKRTLKPEQHVAILKRTVGALSALVIVLAAALAIAITMVVHLMDDPSVALPPEQSYQQDIGI